MEILDVINIFYNNNLLKVLPTINKIRILKHFDFWKPIGINCCKLNWIFSMKFSNKNCYVSVANLKMEINCQLLITILINFISFLNILNILKTNKNCQQNSFNWKYLKCCQQALVGNTWFKFNIFFKWILSIQNY